FSNPPATTNTSGFATSYNLFTGLLPGQNALVRASVTPTNAAVASGVLRQNLSNSTKILLGVGTKDIATSTRLAVPRGDHKTATTLLIANPNDGLDNMVDVFIGQVGIGRTVSNTIPPNGVWAVPLQASDAMSHVVVKSRSIGSNVPLPLLVQLK